MKNFKLLLIVMIFFTILTSCGSTNEPLNENEKESNLELQENNDIKSFARNISSFCNAESEEFCKILQLQNKGDSLLLQSGNFHTGSLFICSNDTLYRRLRPYIIRIRVAARLQEGDNIMIIRERINKAIVEAIISTTPTKDSLQCELNRDLLARNKKLETILKGVLFENFKKDLYQN